MAYTMETASLGNYSHNIAKPSQFAAASALSMPALIFLHGSGQKGNGLADGLTRDAPTPITVANGGTLKRDSDSGDFPIVIFAPYSTIDWSGSGVGKAIKDVVANAAAYKIDVNKIFITGLSLGAISISAALVQDTDHTWYEAFRGAYLLSGSQTNFETVVGTAGKIGAQNCVDRWNETNLEVVKSAYGYDDPNTWVKGSVDTAHLANQIDVDAIQTGIYEVEESYRTFNYNTQVGTFALDETITWGGGTGTGKLLSITDTSPTGKMWISLISGSAPSNTDTLSGGTSSATATINSVPSTVAHATDAWATMYSNYASSGYAAMYAEIETIAASAPVYQSSEVTDIARTKIVLSYNTAFDAGSLPAIGDFQINNLTNQGLFDEMVALVDYGVSPIKTTSGEGGAFIDTLLATRTTPIPFTGVFAASNEVQGLKAFGNNIPASPNSNWIIAGGTEDVQTFGNVWYKPEGSYSHHIDNGNLDQYIRQHNGVRYRPVSSGFTTPIAAPYDEFVMIRIYSGEWEETTGRWKEKGTNLLQYDTQYNTTYTVQRYKEHLLRFKVEANFDWRIEVWGTVVGSGTGATISYAASWLASNGHPMAHHFRYHFAKFTEFSIAQAALVLNNSLAIWGNGYPTFPILDDIGIISSQQWDGVNKLWDLFRNNTVVFRGGNGTGGTHTYQWYYWDGATDGTFPAPRNNKIDYHTAFPGADGTGSTLTRTHYESGNGRGNATIFTNPGIAGNVYVMCVVTPFDSLGVQGEIIVTKWIIDNIP